MASFSLNDLGLQPALLRAAEQKAGRAGQTVAEYVRSLVERDLLADQPFDEMLRPVRGDFRKAGVTEEKLEQIVERARDAAAARRPRRRK